MRTPVVEPADPSVFPARQDDGLESEPPGHELPGLGDLARVREEQPATTEDALHLVGEDTRVRIEATGDAVGLDRLDVVDARCLGAEARIIHASTLV